MTVRLFDGFVLLAAMALVIRNGDQTSMVITAFSKGGSSIIDAVVGMGSRGYRSGQISLT